MAQTIPEGEYEQLSVIQLHMRLWGQEGVDSTAEVKFHTIKEDRPDGDGSDQALQVAKQTALAADGCAIFGGGGRASTVERKMMKQRESMGQTSIFFHVVHADNPQWGIWGYWDPVEHHWTIFSGKRTRSI